MALNIKKVSAEDFGNRLVTILAGHTGAGKTRMSSTWPNPLYLATVDAGLAAVIDRGPAYLEIESSTDLEQVRVALSKPPAERERLLGHPVETVVLDTLDGIQRMFALERLKDENKAQLSQGDYGWLGDQLRALIRGFRNLPVHVVMTVHLKTEKDEETGRLYTWPGLQGALAQEVASYVDLAFLIRAVPGTEVQGKESVRVTKRIVQTAGDVNIPWLKDRFGALPREWEANLNNDFSRIHKAIFKAARRTEDTASSGGEPATSGDSQADQAGSPEAAPPAEQSSKAQAEAAPAAAEAPEQADPPAQPEAETPPAEEQPPVEPEQTETTTEASDAEAPAKEDPAPEAAPEAKEPASKEEKGIPPCELCGGQIETEDQYDLAMIRFRKPLCRSCLRDQKKAS